MGGLHRSLYLTASLLMITGLSVAAPTAFKLYDVNMDAQGNNISDVDHLNPGGNALETGANLKFNGNNIKNCGTINGINCDDLGTSSGTENLSQTLTAGNVANQSIDMDGSGVSSLGSANFSGAVLVGGVDSNNVDDIVIGKGTITQSSNFASERELVIGDEAEASGGGGSMAVGHSAEATYDDAMAIGRSSDAHGIKSLAVGLKAEQRDAKSYQTAIGTLADTKGKYATALGYKASAESSPDNYLSAFGAESSATGDKSTALGGGSSASAQGAVAVGYNADAPNSYEATFGNLNGNQLDVNVTGDLTVHGSDTNLSEGNLSGVNSINPDGENVGIGTAPQDQPLFVKTDADSPKGIYVQNTQTGGTSQSRFSALAGDSTGNGNPDSQITFSAYPNDFTLEAFQGRVGMFSESYGKGINIAALNESGDIRFFAGGSGTDKEVMRIDSNYDVTLNGTLDMDDNNITNYYSSACSDGKFVKDIYDNGTLSCTDAGGGGTENLSQTLEAGNVANQTIRFDNGISIGDSDTKASGGTGEIAIGTGAKAKSDPVGEATSAIAIGEGAKTGEGYSQMAIGDGAEITSNDPEATAIGHSSEAANDEVIALGADAKASGASSLAIGSSDTGSEGAVSSGTDSISIGSDSSATSDHSVAIGTDSNAPNSYEATFGNLNGEELDVNVTGNLTVHGSGGVDVRNNSIDNIDTLNSGGDQVDVGGRLNASGDAVVTDRLDIGDAPDTSYDDPYIESVGSGSTTNDQLRIGTSGGGGADQYVEIWDDQNNQAIIRFIEGGNVNLTNANLSFTSNNAKITGFFNQSKCDSDEAIKTVYPNGSYECNKLSTTTQAENLSETLAAGNIANQTINFDNSNAIKIGAIRDDGSTSAPDTGDYNDIAIGMGADANIDDGSETIAGETAVGSYAKATAKHGTAVGQESKASGQKATGIGYQAEATNSKAVAIGPSADAKDRGVAIGHATTVDNNALNSIAIGGYFTKVTGEDAVAIVPSSGTSDVEASANGAVAIGDDASAPNQYEATFGNLNGEELDVNVTGNLTVHGSGGIDTHGNNITDSTKGNVSVGDSLKVYGSVYANGADLAEIYRSPDSLETAEVVSISGSMDDAVERSEERYDSEVLGVVSANASHLMNADAEGYPIALEGKVPVEVTVSNGEIKRGDRLVPSAEDGVAMKCETIDPMDSEKSLREIVSQNQRCEESTFGRALEPAKTGGKILARIGG